MFRRHELVWLSAAGWQAIRRATPAAQQAALTQFRDLPLMVRRFDVDAPEDCVCLGLPLPPDPRDGHKARLAFVVAADTIIRRTPPPAIADVIATAPKAWQAALQSLSREVAEAGLCLRLHGSLAWQSLSGQAYVQPQSDIDVLLEITSPQQLVDGLALLQRYRAHLPLDGEIVLPSGAAVNWIEWRTAQTAAAGTRVLVKSLKSVRLCTSEALLAEEFALACTD